MIFIKTHDTLRRILEITGKKEKGFYLRIGDGDIMLANGKRAGCQRNEGDIQQEAREFLALEHPNIVKCFPADCKKHGVETWIDGEPVGVEAKQCNTEQRDAFVANLVKKARKYWHALKNSDCKVYSMNAVWYAAGYDRAFAVDFFKQFRSRFDKAVHVGNEFDTPEILELFFGNGNGNNTVHHIKTPKLHAYGEIDRMERELREYMESVEATDYVLINVGSGCSGRCLGKRVWRDYDNIFIMDIGSIMDRVQNRITRTWMKVENVTNEDMRVFIEELKK